LEYGAAFALALVGESKEAEALTDDLQKRFAESTSVRYCYGPALRAQLALNRGDAAGALRMLEVVGPYEAGVHESSVHALFGAMYSTYVRGEAYLALGRGADAAAEFQKIVARPQIVLSDPVGVAARIGKARALQIAGRHAEARAAYDDFLSTWKDADAGIPMLVEAKRERGKLAAD
jgi:hypothetical protein